MPEQITLEKIQEVKHLNSLDFFARQIVEGFITGLHRSPFHGFSVEFAEHRAYNNGESVRFIDWKLFGRTGKLFVKRFEEETNLRCQIVIDASSSMFFPTDNPINKIQFATYASAALIHLLNKQRDAAGLSLFDESLRFHTKARLTQSHIQTLYAQLDELLQLKYKPKARANTQIADVLHQIAEAANKRSLIVVFSDMFEQSDPEPLFNAIEHLRYNKHEVVIFHVHDSRYELNLKLEDRPYKLIDMESGEEMKLKPQDFRSVYAKKMEEFYETIRNKCLQYKVDFVTADINKPFDQVLTSFLTRRTKMF
ncbi:MAG: DUF58 domain-containing protein [Salinivirgaceae bacterium]|nr:MAG: DUF58 domain-containing protein [Salinivirgaceae bacterium]